MKKRSLFFAVILVISLFFNVLYIRDTYELKKSALYGLCSGVSNLTVAVSAVEFELERDEFQYDIMMDHDIETAITSIKHGESLLDISEPSSELDELKYYIASESSAPKDKERFLEDIRQIHSALKELEEALHREKPDEDSTEAPVPDFSLSKGEIRQAFLDFSKKVGPLVDQKRN